MKLSFRKRIKCFSFILCRGLKTTKITDNFGFLFVENSFREIILSQCHGFRKTLFLKYFLSTRNQKPGVLNFFRFHERFQIALFS